MDNDMIFYIYTCIYNHEAMIWDYTNILSNWNPICDWIWENPASTHKYKYLEIPILII